jgi:hypothetical protein
MVDTTGGRPEGLTITGNKIILTGTEHIALRTCFGVIIHGNVIDQSGGFGVYLNPAGVGVDAVSISDNYIATASAPTSGTGVGCVTGVGGVRGLQITGNQFQACGYGISLLPVISDITITGNSFDNINQTSMATGQAVNVSVSGNVFRGSNVHVSLTDGASGGPVSLVGNSFPTTGSVSYSPTDVTKFHFYGNIGKKFSGWSSLITPTISSGTSGYYFVPHGLAVTPNIGKVVATPAAGSGGFINPTCNIVAVDATNVQVQAVYTVSVAGTLRLNVHASA